MSIEVQTTQNVTIDYEPAGLGYRMLAYIVDWVIIIIWLLGWFGILYMSLNDGMVDMLTSSSFGIFLFFIMLCPVIFYDLLFEIFNYGQSPGKMIFKIRVINVDGTTPSFGAYMLRWLFRLIDMSFLYYSVVVITIAVTKKSQRLGDLIAGTTVIDLKLNSKKNLSLPELDFHEDYKVTYIDVLDKLSDRDIQTIRSIIEDVTNKNSDHLATKLAERIKQITNYQYEGDDTLFLRKVVNDYNFQALQY